MDRSRNKQTENIEIQRESTRVSHALHIFSYLHYTENVENTSVSVYSETPITI